MSRPCEDGIEVLSTLSPVVRTLLPVTAAVWAIFEIRQGMQRRTEATAVDHGSRMVIRVCTLIGVVGAVTSRRALTTATIGTGPDAEWLGLILMWCGIGLRLWSFQTLGRYFTFTVQTSDDQTVVSTGPYRVIRHPGYAGILLAVVGIGFVMDNWISLVVLTAGVACGLVYRIRVEEGALSRDLGGRYQDYARNRKRLVPFVW